MADLYSRYESENMVIDGAITGSIMGVSGVNAIADRLNSIAIQNNLITGSIVSGTDMSIYCKQASGLSYNYKYIIENPSFSGTSFTSDAFYLNENISKMRIRGSIYESGAGSNVYGVLGVGNTGSFLSPGDSDNTDNYPLAVDSNNNLVVNPGTSFGYYIFKMSGISSTITGSFNNNNVSPLGIAFDTSDNLLTFEYIGGYNYIKTHDGFSATIAGSFEIGQNILQGDITVDPDNNLILYKNDYIYTYDGISSTPTGSFYVGTYSLDGISVDSSSNLIAVHSFQYLRVYDGISSTMTGSYYLGYRPVGVALDTSDNAIVAREDYEYIYLYSGTTNVPLLAGDSAIIKEITNLEYNTNLNYSINKTEDPQIALQINKSLEQNQVDTLIFEYS